MTAKRTNVSKYRARSTQTSSDVVCSFFTFSLCKTWPCASLSPEQTIIFFLRRAPLRRSARAALLFIYPGTNGRPDVGGQRRRTALLAFRIKEIHGSAERAFLPFALRSRCEPPSRCDQRTTRRDKEKRNAVQRAVSSHCAENGSPRLRSARVSATNATPRFVLTLTLFDLFATIAPDSIRRASELDCRISRCS